MNQVPWLRSGVGQTPSDGGCIMQVIDWINRNEWTDSPPCVHPVLRRLAIRANDSLDDQGRQKLLDLAPRLMNTNNVEKVVSVRLGIFCANKVLHLFEEKFPGDSRPRLAIEAAETWCDDPSVENLAKCKKAGKEAWNARHAAAYAAAAVVYAAYAAYAAAAVVYAADAAAAVVYAAAAAAVKTIAPYDFLVEVLGEYERLAGKKEEAKIDYSGVCEVMAGSRG